MIPQLPIEQILRNAIQHHRTGQLQEAELLYRQILTQQPDHTEALLHIGIIAHQIGHVDLAVDLIQRAIALKPNYPEAYSNLGNALTAKGQLDEAMAAYRKALALKPSYADAHSNLVYTQYFHPACNAQTIAEEHGRWNCQHADSLKKHILSYANDRNPDRRLRIGYVSPNFRTHCQSLFMMPLLSAHDHHQVEVFCYADVVRPDARTGQMQIHADVWRSIVGFTDEQVAATIRQDGIDILVDLTMHMAKSRLRVFARKPAPVQVCWLAHPGSTGLTTIDYRLSDPYLDPPGMDESVYSERTVRLPDSFWCYDPLDGRDIPVNSLPALQTGVITFGCLNNFCKVNQGILTLWAQLLRQVDGSRLLLLTRPGDHQQRTTEFLTRHGVQPVRVEFLDFRPRQKYLELYHRIDLGLDSFPYNGHTTSLDSFWMGVPVVTLVGQTAVSRAGWCQLSNLGLTELAGHTPEQFVRIASELAHDLPRLGHLRSTLRQHMEQSPLMDAPRFARNIEAAYRQMWRQWCH